MTDSQTLLAEYVQTGSDAAFLELVTRYVDLVYSTALRLVENDKHRAEDVAQTVFVDLARAAQTFSGEVKLGGWLHRHTCFVAAKMMRGERRRQSRERQAVEMNVLQDNSEVNFSMVGPILDEAINELGEADRTAILLRFFEQQEESSRSTLKKSLTAYMQGNNGAFPTDLAQLRQHFDPPVEDSVLQRWEIAPASTVQSLGLGGDVIITQKAPVDDVFDTRFGIGPFGTGSTDFLDREAAGTMGPVREAYRAAHNGQWPTASSQLLPYVTTPEQQVALQKLILRDSVAK